MPFSANLPFMSKNRTLKFWPLKHFSVGKPPSANPPLNFQQTGLNNVKVFILAYFTLVPLEPLFYQEYILQNFLAITKNFN